MTRVRVVDIETAGLEPPDHKVVEIGWCDLVDGENGWGVEEGRSVLVNPGRAIPPETSAVHHLVDEDVAGGVDFIAGYQMAFPQSRPIIAIAAHNCKFERQWLTDEVTGLAPWICTYKAALRIWPEAPAHSNQALRYWLRPAGLNRAIAARAHRAFEDAYVTAFILRELLGRASIEQLVTWTAEPALQIRCGLGKWRGAPWRDVDDGFLRWVLGKDFDEDVLFTVRHELAKREAERAAS